MPDDFKNINDMTANEETDDVFSVSSNDFGSALANQPMQPQPQYQPQQQAPMNEQPVYQQDMNNSWGQSPTGYTNPPMRSDAGTTALGVGAVIWLVIKCIISFFIPIGGFIASIVSKGKGHRGRSKLYLLLAVLGMVTNIIVTFCFGSVISDKIEYGDYDSSYSDDYDADEDATIDWTVDYTTTDETVSESATEGATQNSAVNASSDWQDYTITIDGATVKLPCTWSEFSKATGYDFKDAEDRTTTLKNNQYTTSVRIQKGDVQMSVRFINTEGSQKTLSECQVAGVSVSDYDKDANVVFASGMQVGDSATSASIEKMFGTPSRTYDSDSSNYHIYTYEPEDYSYNKMEITVSDGNISDVRLEHFDF